jgi:hypothetical protein
MSPTFRISDVTFLPLIAECLDKMKRQIEAVEIGNYGPAQYRDTSDTMSFMSGRQVGGWAYYQSYIRHAPKDPPIRLSNARPPIT